MLGFVRITTNRRALARPLPVREAMAQVKAWLALEFGPKPGKMGVRRLSDVHMRQVSALELPATSPPTLTWQCSPWNVVTSLYSTDTDFGRFNGPRWVNPYK